MAKKESIEVKVEAFVKVALTLRDALEAMESELIEEGYLLKDFEEADREIEKEEDEGKDRKKPRFPKLS